MKNIIKTEISYADRLFSVKVFPEYPEATVVSLRLVIRPHRRKIGRYEAFGFTRFYHSETYNYNISSMILETLGDYCRQLEHKKNIQEMWEKGIDK